MRAAKESEHVSAIRRVYSRWGKHPSLWNPDHDLIGTMREVLGDVTIETFNGGSLFLATAIKTS